MAQTDQIWESTKKTITHCWHYPHPLLPLFYEDPHYIAFPFCVILLNDIMDPHMSNLGNLVAEGTYCGFYATRRQVR